MKLLELVTELEIDSPAANIGTPLRSVAIGKYLDLKADNRVVDFGCGRGEMLCLWARCFAITGIGVDSDQPSLTDAASRAGQWGVADRVEFRCQDMKEFGAADHVYDVATCMGATMGFGGFEATLVGLKRVIKPAGAIVVAEPFYLAKEVPAPLLEYEGQWHVDTDLFDIAHKHGLEVGYYARAGRDEWERYIFSSRREEMRLFAAMPPGPAKEERRRKLHRWHDMYLRYRQHWQCMAFMTLHA
jgi:SAM-dependent methyltransferase